MIPSALIPILKYYPRAKPEGDFKRIPEGLNTTHTPPYTLISPFYDIIMLFLWIYLFNKKNPYRGLQPK
jgi:hypothetical protein